MASLILKIGTRLSLCAPEIKECWRIGLERFKRNKMSHSTDRRYSKRRSSEDISVQGVMGEMALLRMMNQSTESLLDTTPRNAHNDTFDASTAHGKTIDVKTVMTSNRPLYIHPHKQCNPADYYALLRMWPSHGGALPGQYNDSENAVFVFEGAVPSKECFNTEYKHKVYKNSGEQMFMVPRVIFQSLSIGTDSFVIR